MEITELEKMLGEMRGQLVGLEAKITDLEGLKKGSAGEKKATQDLISTLKSEIEAIRGELAIKAAPPVIAVASAFDLMDPSTW